MQLTVILSLIFAIVIAIFAGLNSDVVNVNLLFTKVEMSLAIVILISAIIGSVIVYFMNIVKSLRRGKEIKQLTKEMKKLQASERKLTQEKLELKTKVEELEKGDGNDTDIMEN